MPLIPGRRHYLAILLLSLSILVLEIAISRLLSVALFSHFAFVAVSLAMFGISLGALVVYLFPRHYAAERLDRQLVFYSALFGASTAVCVPLFLQIKVVQELSLQGFATLSSVYGVLAVPFFFGGLCVALLMTHCSAQIGRLYFADLLGASLGCMAAVAALGTASAPLVVLGVGAVVAVAALVVALSTEPRRLSAPAASCAVAGVLVLLASTTDLYSMRYIKNQQPHYSEYEAWNAFSRISAFEAGHAAAETIPLPRPGSSYKDSPNTKILDIDGAAWTLMMNFDRDLSRIQFLQESVLYVAHHLKPAADVLIIGTGGGRDILAALAFHQRSVTGIEINPLMRHVVEERFGDYSGRPYSYPGVHVLIDEGRSRLSRLDRRFDVIQLSLIDTFSLNAAGGFVFSENYLYTIEAFREYFRHLSPDGILSLTRYFVPTYKLEILRLAGMVRVAWSAEGVRAVGDHVIVLSQGINATLLAKRSPFSPTERLLVKRLAGENHMRVLYSPGQEAANPALAKILTTPDLPGYFASQPFVLDPPTDDRPFFFNFLRARLGDVPIDQYKFLQMWDDALALMYLLIAVVTTIAALFLVGPLLVLGRGTAGHVGRARAAPLLLYFACLGYGFMIIEVPLLQRFVLFLGHPVYALAVVLFALLLFSGIGSLLSASLVAEPRRALVIVLVLIMGLATVYCAVLPQMIAALLGRPIGLRIALTAALLAPIGLVLGMAYPLGITILRRFDAGLVPWAWGLNGALSVVASVLAIFIGSRLGFSAALLTGVAAYGVALVAMGIATRQRVTETGASL